MTTQPVTRTAVAPRCANADTALPPECAAAEAAFRAVLACSAGADEWDALTRRAVLGWLAAQRDLVAAVEGRVLTAEREAGTWSLQGDRDLAGFVGRQTRTGRGAGMAAVAQAGTLAALPTVADALVDGPVTAMHIAQLARATSSSAALAAELATPEGQAQVVDLARRLDGSEFGKALARLSASVDPAGRQRSHDEQRANRSFAWTHTPSGTLVRGRLDTVAGHRLAKVIDALSPRPAVVDDRTREQRQADALMAIVERAATDRNTTPGSLAPVQAVLTMTQETWAALRARPASERAAGQCVDGRDAAGSSASRDLAAPGSAVGLIGHLAGVVPVTDESGQAWPASEVARALCDCTLTRAVVDAPDVELNLGRESRAFTRRHWLALYAAGVTGCSIDACGMPLAYCELHHIRWWYEHDGLTNIANCLPYCSFHHHEIHRNNITITRLPDGRIEHRYPDGRIYGAPPPAYRPEVTAQPGDTPLVATTRAATPPGPSASAGTRMVDTAGDGTMPSPAAPAGPPSTAGPPRGRAAEGPPGDSRERPPEDPTADLLELLSA